ncbi:MAG: transcription antitermination factor NusB [Clostridiales bacterium]|jgi:N utilization substance protein B|nr:transcription antitermination factor NusB [Clostridiales bacterium]
MSRRESREAAMKLLFQYDFQKDDLEELIKLFFENDAEFVVGDIENDYVLNVARGVVENIEEIDRLIEINSKGWKLSRMPRVDIAILRVAVYEMLYRKDIPASVSINEAVEVAKRYSNPDAGIFINGILASVFTECCSNG